MRFNALGVGVLAACLNCSPTFATPLTWDGSVGNWDTEASWLPDLTEPTSIDDVIITGGEVDVTVAGEEASEVTLNGGSLNISNSGSLSGTDSYLARTVGSMGLAVVTGPSSMWSNSGDLNVGYAGVGTLNIEDSGFVTNNRGLIGRSFGSTGIVTVTGVGSTWTNSGDLSVGDTGTGTLIVEAGGSVTSDGAHIGFYYDSTGAATVTGSGSSWLNLGRLYVGSLGNGTLNIQDGGVVHVMRGTLVGLNDTGGGTINLASGTLNTAGLFASPDDLLGTGTINTNGIVSNIDLVFDATHGLQQQIVLDSLPGQQITINLDASDPTNTSTLGAGYHGTGTLTIADGVSVSSSAGSLGQRDGSTGVATVTGAGSTWTCADDLYIGQYGDGTLNIEAGGVVKNNGDGYINYGWTSPGFAAVTGPGSKWTNSGNMYVGYWGNGTLDIVDGGLVTSTDSHIGYLDGSQGVVTVSGVGSVWSNSGHLSLGGFIPRSDGGNGVLNIQDGGVVSIAAGSIGNASGTSGVVTITGAGSRLTVSGDLHVGGTEGLTGGNSYLNVLDGGLVTMAGFLRMRQTGTVQGDGQIMAANLINEGIVAPGNSTGTLTLTGDYTQESGGTLAIEVAGGGGAPGVDYDRLEVNGDVTLAGTLKLTLLDTGYLPAIGDVFSILTADSVTGIFNELTGRIISEDRGFSISYLNGQSVVVEVVPMSPIIGDLTGDGFVGIDDLNIVLGKWNQNVTASVWPLGDVSGDGFVGIEDLNAVLGNWNAGIPPAFVIPEPSAATILVAVSLATCGRRVARRAD